MQVTVQLRFGAHLRNAAIWWRSAFPDLGFFQKVLSKNLGVPPAKARRQAIRL